MPYLKAHHPKMTSERRSTNHSKWNQAFVSFNNQDTILMSMYIQSMSLLCLLHDNRVYGFDRRRKKSSLPSASSSTTEPDQDQDPNPEEDTNSYNSTEEQNLLLNLLTTPKYRGMSAIYLVFHLTDHMGLLFFIIRTIMGVDKKHGLSLTPAEQALISTIGIELFYDVMLKTHKFWNLQRLSIYIGILLYIFYFSILGFANYKPDEFKLVLSVLLIRLVSFICEELVDIAIDGALHNDLLRLQKRKEVEAAITEITPLLTNQYPYDEGQEVIFKKSWWTTMCTSTKNYLSIRNMKMPSNVDYKGSFFAWLPWSVFSPNVWNQNSFPTILILLFCLVPLSFVVVALIFILPILLIAMLVALFVCLITWKWEITYQLRNYGKEMAYF